MKNVTRIIPLLLAWQGLSGCFERQTATPPAAPSSTRWVYQYIMPALSATTNQVVSGTRTSCVDSNGNQVAAENCASLALQTIPTKNLCAGKSALQDNDCDPTALKALMATKEASYEANGTISWAIFNADQLANKNKVVQLRQSDFATGTLRIKQPCKVKLMEDVQFNPNRGSFLADGKVNPARTHDWYPEYGQNNHEYDSTPDLQQAYSLGFFAAMTLENDGIIVDLNQNTLSMHPEFRIMQQFYAHIELSDRPFAPSNGPVNFGNPLKSAHNVLIKNGTLGASSHQGIHGNDASDVLISGVTIKDFTVAGISLNGSKNIQILDSVIDSNVVEHVYGGYSELRFDTLLLKGYQQYKLAGGVDVFGAGYAHSAELKAAYDEAKTAVELVFNEIKLNGALTATPAGTLTNATKPANTLNTNDNRVLRNRIKLTDAAAYGIVINPSGNATGPFLESLLSPGPSQPSDIFIARTKITAVNANPREISALSSALSPSQISSSYVVSGISGNQRGPTGSLFDYWNTLSTTALTTTGAGGAMTGVNSGAYVGNVVSNLQIELAALQDTLPSQEKPMLGQISMDPMLVTMKRDAVNTIPAIQRYRIVPLGTAITASASVGGRIFIVVDSSAIATGFPRGTPVLRDGGQIMFASLGNGDVQHHVLKGIFGIRADGVKGLTLVDMSVSGVDNHTVQGFSPIASGVTLGYTGSLDGGHEGQSNMVGYSGNHARGISVYASENVKMESVIVSNIKSETGPAWGIEINNLSTGIKLSDLNISDIFGDNQTTIAGVVLTGAARGGTAPYARPTFTGSISPNWSPVAATLDIDDSVSSIKMDKTLVGSFLPASVTPAAWLGLP